MYEWLRSLKVGDKVSVVRGGSCFTVDPVREGVVESVTKTLVKVVVGAGEPKSYFKRNGVLKGAVGWVPPRIDEYDLERIMDARERKRHACLVGEMERYDWSGLTGDEIDRVVRFVKKIVKERGA